ncbi:MAG: hypothetical protein JW734_06535 [Candidatus Omnitrophica bacterium]|nr:hypothetical protein [Candidatus Omnitrophota bacterium]
MEAKEDKTKIERLNDADTRCFGHLQIMAHKINEIINALDKVGVIKAEGDGI